MADRRRFWNWIAARYARMPVPDEAAYRHKLELTRARLRPDMRVLELGCGTGTTAVQHAPHVAAYHGVDYAGAMIAIARGKAAEAGLENLTFEVAGVEELDMPAGSVDAVLAMSLLHLVPDRAALMARIFRLTRPGGLFVSSTVCAGDMPAKVRLIASLVRALPVLPDVASLTEAGLVAEIEAAGFEVEERWRPSPSQALFCIARRPGGAAEG